MTAPTMPPVLAVNIDGRTWPCRPTMAAGVAAAAARLGFVKLDTIPEGRRRRRVANNFYRKFLQRQVVGSHELLALLRKQPALWPEAVTEACELAERYIAAGLVD